MITIQKYQLIVSEPWDYAGPDGTNKVVGEIVEMDSPTILLFKANQQLIFGNLSGNLLILKPRYTGDFFVPGSQQSLTVGGALIINENPGSKTVQQLQENSKYVLIGSLSAI